MPEEVRKTRRQHQRPPKNLEIVYMEGSLIVQPGKVATVAELVKATVPHWEKAGIKFVGSWNTVIGNTNEVTFLFAYEDMAQVQKVSQALAQDKEYQAMYQKVEAITVSLTQLKA